VTELGVATSVSQFSRQIGSTVGVAIFGALLTHGLTTELQKHLPPLPGAAPHKVDLSNAQSQAMNAASIRGNVEAAMQVRYQAIERAYHGDRAAAAQVLEDRQLPESLKAPLRDGAAISAATAEKQLELVRAAMPGYSAQLVDRIRYGTKLAFSASITQMLGSALWIVIAGVLIVLFIPELPLRSGTGAPTRVEV
jgi:hypothetical protein